MTSNQRDRVIAAMGKLSLANGATDDVDAILLLEEAHALLRSVSRELEREISVWDEVADDRRPNFR